MCARSPVERKLESNNTVTDLCKEHVVGCPKYRRKILVNGVDKRLKAILREVAAERQAEVIEWEGMPDYVHVWVKAAPLFGIRLV